MCVLYLNRVALCANVIHFRSAGRNAIPYELRRNERAEGYVRSRSVPLCRRRQDLAQQKAVTLRLERVYSHWNSGSRVIDEVSQKCGSHEDTTNVQGYSSGHWKGFVNCF